MSKTLTLDETRKNLVLWREGRDRKALTTLVMANTSLVQYIAAQYSESELSMEELISAGNEGLLTAISNFDYYANGIESFAMHIAYAIEDTIQDEIDSINRYNKVTSIYNNKKDKEVRVGVNNLEYKKPNREDVLAAEDLIGEGADKVIEDVLSNMEIETVREGMEKLTPRERQIVLLRYGLDEINKRSQGEIAKMLKCSEQEVKDGETKALSKMRKEGKEDIKICL